VVGAPYLILDVEMELMQVCGPLMMAIILKFSLCLHELQRLMISVDECFLPENIMPPLATHLYNGVHLFIVSGVFTNDIRYCLTMIGHGMSVLSEKCAHNIV
jgi:hypothetical protein